MKLSSGQCPFYARTGALLSGLSKYFVEYNGGHPVQALDNKTPDTVNQSASGGGVMIVDKYGTKVGLPIALTASGTAIRGDIPEKTLGINL
jgi:hypothetical protein